MHTAVETSLTSLASIQPIQGWEEFLENGNGYMRTATGAYAKGNKVFTPGILYNVIAMAIEKFVMAALMRHGTMPYNHTMVDLVEAMEETFPDTMEDIGESLIRLDAYQDICDPYDFTIIEPDMDEIPVMLNLAVRLQKLVQDELT